MTWLPFALEKPFEAKAPFDVLSELGQASQSEASYRSALSSNPRLTHTLSNLIFNLNYAEQSTALSIGRGRALWRLASAMRKRCYDEWRCETSPSRLRVRFVSAICGSSGGIFHGETLQKSWRLSS